MFLCGFLDVLVVPENEAANTADLKPLSTKYIHYVWQKEWDKAVIVSN